MELNAGYKNTEIGVIPEDWELKTIGEISSLVRGGSPRPAGDPKYFNGDFIPWLTVAALTNIPESQLYVNETNTKLTKEGAGHSRTLEIGTIIIANSGFSLGISKILNIKCCANDGIAAMLDFDNNLDKEFVTYYLNTLTEKLRKVIAIGNDQPNLNKERIGRIAIPVPPKDEQTTIATALSNTNALISTLEKLILKKRNIKQGAMQKLLQPKERWEIKKLGEIAEIYQPKTISQNVFIEDGYLVYGANGVVGKYHLFNHETWQSTITCRGSTCGTVNRTVGKSWITGNAMVMNVDKNSNIDKLFFYYILRKQDFNQCITGSGQPQIVRNPLFEFKISIPKKEEQVEIANILSDMDNEITALENKLEKYRKIKLGMIQNLLTGKIRLL